jgi:hypothetical protein
MTLHICNDIICRAISGVKSAISFCVFLHFFWEASTSFVTGILNSSCYYPEPDIPMTSPFQIQYGAGSREEEKSESGETYTTSLLPLSVHRERENIYKSLCVCPGSTRGSREGEKK